MISFQFTAFNTELLVYASMLFAINRANIIEKSDPPLEVVENREIKCFPLRLLEMLGFQSGI